MDDFDMDKVENRGKLKDWLAAFEVDFKARHPIQYWIDRVLFRGKSLGGSAPHVTLAEPWSFFTYYFAKIDKAIERMRKGWDYSAVWAINSYLADLIPQLTRSLKENMNGIASDFFDVPAHDINGFMGYTHEEEQRARKKFGEVLDGIADGFEAYGRIETEMLWDDPNNAERTEAYRKNMAAFKTGMELFVKYFDCLGD